MRKVRVALAGLIAASALVGVVMERDARACGGCFIPPTDNPTVVTDHRMVLSVSLQQTTLYDQIRYQGSPDSFAWVLPIRGVATVGLSSDGLFGTLDAMTQVQVQQPPTRCPTRPSSCNDGLFGASASSEAAGRGGADDGVTVTRREVVGPYETVQLKSTDPQALSAWFARNNFRLPDDVQPIVAAYVAEKFDFLALKLVPGAGVQAMRPVRVSTSGASAVLPLRMVAAGTGQNVGITLWIIGEGRYEPQNFPFFLLKNEDIAWDWAKNASNYRDLRADKTRESGGKAWELETSLAINQQSVAQALEYGWFGNGGGGGAPPPQVTTDYPSTPLTDAESRKLRQQDLDTLFQGVPANSARITRIRADLARAALGDDLKLIASKDQALVQSLRLPQKEIGQPLCTVWRNCSAGEQRPRDEAIALSTTSGGESFSCTTAREDATSAGLAAIGLAGVVGVAFARGRRKRVDE